MNTTITMLVRRLHSLEENFIALCLGAMTALTFANVIARYVFSSNILWALEASLFLFAWLILVGASYGVRAHFHIGVDIVIKTVNPRAKKVLALLSVALCLLFAGMLCVGAFSYWIPFVDPAQQSWYEVEDVPIPTLLNWLLTDTMNHGEAYEKLPRFIPYFALPLGTSLLVLRFMQQAWHIWHNHVDCLIAGHEINESSIQKELKS